MRREFFHVLPGAEVQARLVTAILDAGVHCQDTGVLLKIKRLLSHLRLQALHVGHELVRGIFPEAVETNTRSSLKERKKAR